jgi:hypothetical protein
MSRQMCFLSFYETMLRVTSSFPTSYLSAMDTLLPLIAETYAKALIKALDVETETADSKVLFVLRSRTLFLRSQIWNSVTHCTGAWHELEHKKWLISSLKLSFRCQKLFQTYQQLSVFVFVFVLINFWHSSRRFFGLKAFFFLSFNGPQKEITAHYLTYISMLILKHVIQRFIFSNLQEQCCRVSWHIDTLSITNDLETRWKILSQAFEDACSLCCGVNERLIGFDSFAHAPDKHNMICEIIPWERLQFEFQNSLQFNSRFNENAFTFCVVMYFLLFHIFLSLWKKISFLVHIEIPSYVWIRSLLLLSDSWQ